MALDAGTDEPTLPQPKDCAVGYRGAMPDAKIPFDARNPDSDAVRQIVIERLRRDASWSQLDHTGDG